MAANSPAAFSRLSNLMGHIMPPAQSHGNLQTSARDMGLEIIGCSAVGEPSNETVTVTDNRTGKQYTIPIKNNTLLADEFWKVKHNGEGLRLYDPAFMNTALAKSRICFIDGDKGILWYRGYPIEELATRSSFLEVAFLLINGELPSKAQLGEWSSEIMQHTYLHENLTSFLKTFRYDAHPMGIVVSSIAALGTFYPEANPALHGENIYKQHTMRNKQIFRIIGKLPTIAACAYRHRIGRPYNLPSPAALSYTENFLYMLDALNNPSFRPDPRLVRALDVLFVLHADHEFNCSTAAMRHVASSGADPYSATAAAAAALYGPLHGGANEAVLRMLEQIGSPDKVDAFIEGVKKKERKLMGFGHRVYKNYDPRAKIIKELAYEVFSITGSDPLIEVATTLEQRALADPYFTSRKLYPNVDFYSGLIYKAMGFPTDMFPVLFCIPRVVGWLAHWLESIDDPETKIFRPRQVYLGHEKRPFVPIDQRVPPSVRSLAAYSSALSKRVKVKPVETSPPVSKYT